MPSFLDLFVGKIIGIEAIFRRMFTVKDNRDGINESD
jgi:hypothetical protein